MAAISKQEENYSRMSFLITGLSQRAVRVFFNDIFPPASLQSTLNQNYSKLKKSGGTFPRQWDLMFPKNGVADSKTFDITLMILLIKKLGSDIVGKPAIGDNDLPEKDDETPGADLARIKYYRNYLGHVADSKIDDTLFTRVFELIPHAVQRLGGPSLYQECQDLKTKILDQSYHEKIKLEIQKLKEQIAAEERNDTVPWNIREQMKTKQESWRKEDQMFVENRAASHVLQSIETNSCVTVTGSSGVGKTFTVRHVALQMAADGYDILPVKNPKDIIKYHNPNKKTLYVIDDLCGTYTLNQTYCDKWKTMEEDIKELLENDSTKIIASCRLQVYQDEQFKLLPLFTACECNLLLPNMSLSNDEKQSIAEKYLKSDASKITHFIDLFDFFPLLCRLYYEHQALNVVDFFKNPFSVYEEEIDKLKTEKAHGKYCALALCVMFNNHLKEEWLTDDVNHEIKQIIENTCEACRLNRTTPRLVLKDELDSLVHTFLKKEQGCYHAIHDKLFDFFSFYFGKKKEMLHCIIKSGDSRFISERLLFKKKDCTDRLTTILPDEYQQLYIERMFDDWSKGEVVTVFTNINMKSPEFRNTFLSHLRNLDIRYQKDLANKIDTGSCIADGAQQNSSKNAMRTFRKTKFSYMHTPLLHCCALGDTDMVEWCYNCKADLNYCSIIGESPLFIACKEGHTNLVTRLVANKADINKCTQRGDSPLFIACKVGNADIVTKLVANKADINTTSKDEESPLYIACTEGFLDIVTNLVDNKAEINKCPKNGETPLYKACKGGFKEIVTKLVDNKADINKCRWDEASPLYIACKGGHADIVIKLLENKADINKCTVVGESPLYKACEGGFTAIVTKLVDNKADINKCRYNEASPLYIACKGGYTDIVTKLIENKADINKCTRTGESPLSIACKQGFIQIVQKLINKGADLTKCDKLGQSPLDIAKLKGHDDIVDWLTKHF